MATCTAFPQAQSFEDIFAASDAFFNNPGLDADGKNIPTENRVKALVAAGVVFGDEVAECAAAVRPLCHPEVMALCCAYLKQRQHYGTEIERLVYEGMDISSFLERLLTKRPLMFMGTYDSWVLRDGSNGYGFWEDLHNNNPLPEPWVRAPCDHGLCWAQVLGAPVDGHLKVRWHYDGSEGQVPVCQVEWYDRPLHLIMDEYLCYPEVQLSALLSMIVPTHFINNGRRDNCAVCDQGNYQRSGIYIAQVGCRFKKEGVQEYELFLATYRQNRLEDGFGWEGAPCRNEHPAFQRRKLWAQLLWQKDAFPSYEEACADRSGRFLGVADGVLLDTVGFHRRMTWVIEPFLLVANALAGEKAQSAYVHCVGLGLGVWLGDCNTEIGELEVAMQQFKVYVEVLGRHDFLNVSVVDLSWFPMCLGIEAKKRALPGLTWQSDQEAQIPDKSGRKVVLRLSQRNPAAPIPEGHLLVAQYAWDGNAYPGNEYWQGSRMGSGDSAAASCSTIGELQNPSINPNACVASKIQVLPKS
jgi:hypothetical protein